MALIRLLMYYRCSKGYPAVAIQSMCKGKIKALTLKSNDIIRSAT